MQNALETAEVGEIRRCYVLKKPGRDPEAISLQHFLSDQLGVGGINITTGYRYDIDGLTEEEFAMAQSSVLVEAPVNDVLDQDAFEGSLEGKTALLIEPLPGQYDQMADSAIQCIELNTGIRPRVRVAEIIILEGKIPADALEALKHYRINPTDSHEASTALPTTLEENLAPSTGLIPSIEGFEDFDDDALLRTIKDMGLAMTLPDMRKVQEYFRSKGRPPVVTELKVIDTYWSDHCRHTTFTTELTSIRIPSLLTNAGHAIRRAAESFIADRAALYGDKVKTHKQTLMDLALFSMREAKVLGRLEDLEDSEENNAASIVVTVEFEDGSKEEWLLMFKNETHNHPTEIEPVGGAATCLGGAIRDPLSGRAPVIMGMRVTGSGDPRENIEDTLPGKLSQHRITTGAAIGFSGYGNQIGVPTLKVHEYYDARFKAKRLEVGFVAGAVRRDQVRRETPAPGDVVIVLGGATGRDGIGGASGSSIVHDQDSVSTKGAEVQKGNPVIERHIQRLFTNPDVSRLIKRCNDFGAGGVSVAIGEVADGIDVYLDAIRLKYTGLDATEIAISESQERMTIVVSANDDEAFIAAAAAENLHAQIAGVVTERKALVMKRNGQTVCDLDRDFLSGGWAERSTNITLTDPGDVRAYFLNQPRDIQGMTLQEKWLSNLNRLSVASQRGLQQRFDSTVGANTVVGPFGGLYQATPSEAAVTSFPAEGAITRFATSESFDPELSIMSPYHGGMYAVIDSIAKLVASGASPENVRLTLQNYFEKLTDDERWGKPFLAQLGAREAQKHLHAPAIGGKDSMSGTFINRKTGERLDVPPTLVSFAVAVMQHSIPVPSSFEDSGNHVVHLKTLINEGGEPDWDMLLRTWRTVHKLQQIGAIRSAQAVHAGGIAAALTTMSLGNRVGMHLTNIPPDDQLFSPLYGSLVVEVDKGENIDELLSDLPYSVLGTTTESPMLEFGDDSRKQRGLGLSLLQQRWEEPLDHVFPLAPENRGNEATIPGPIFVGQPKKAETRIARPRVSVLTFPGTNCEMETERAFNRAGGKASVSLFLNRRQSDIRESIERMARDILQSQIVAIPGGFSAGDQPDGSAKFIASVLRNERIKDALYEHIDRGGLVIGICNGFQALIKSCLLPNGKIRMLEANDPTLSHNDKGHFLSMNVRHSVVSTKSPWMSKFNVGESTDIPIAHGEGKLIQVPESVWTSGQVPFQYAGRDGIARNVFPDNPNGSDYSIAGLTDVTGRIFGMMGHPERAIEGRQVNIPTDRKGQRIFNAGIEYFA